MQLKLCLEAKNHHVRAGKYKVSNNDKGLNTYGAARCPENKTIQFVRHYLNQSSCEHSQCFVSTLAPIALTAGLASLSRIGDVPGRDCNSYVKDNQK